MDWMEKWKRHESASPEVSAQLWHPSKPVKEKKKPNTLLLNIAFKFKYVLMSRLHMRGLVASVKAVFRTRLGCGGSLHLHEAAGETQVGSGSLCHWCQSGWFAAEMLSWWPHICDSATRCRSTSIQKLGHMQQQCESCPHGVLAAGAGIPTGAQLLRGFSTCSPRIGHFSQLEAALYSSTFVPDLTNICVFFAVMLPVHVTPGRKATRGQWEADLEEVLGGFSEGYVVAFAK